MNTRNIIAILRGVTPNEVEAIADALIASGISQIEVPLNSPSALQSIKRLASKFAGVALIGAGTVLSVDDVKSVAEVGAQLIVSPDCNPEVIKAAKATGLVSIPGVMTPTECFAALRAGADGLKLFPASLIGPEGVKAMRAVLPPQTNIYAVGGADASNLQQWKKAGATGFGIGTAIYKPTDTAQAVRQKAATLIAAYDAAFAGSS